MTPRPQGVFDVIVVGGGVNGLATAWQLARRGAGRIGLVERFELLHDRGASHGPTRITRSSYAEPHLVARMAEANAEDWPALEAAAGRPLRRPCPTFFFGPADGEIGAYAAAVAAAGAGRPGVAIDAVPPAQGRAAAGGWLRIDDGDVVLHDRTGAVIDAAGCLRALIDLVRAAGVAVYDGVPVTSIGVADGPNGVSAGRPADGPVTVETAAGPLLAERVVVTAGAWIGRLLPSLAGRLTPLRQTVAMLDVPGDPTTAPNWVRVGGAGEPDVFGQPALGHAGLKAAIHRQSGPPAPADDPDVAVPFDAAAPAVAELRAALSRCLAVPVRGVVGGMTCLYTMTADHDFILGPLPHNPRIIVGAACSGHAFKFAPWTGRMLADWAIDGRGDGALAPAA